MLNVTVDLFFWSYTFIQVENMQIMDKITEMHFLLTLLSMRKANKICSPCSTSQTKLP